MSSTSPELPCFYLTVNWDHSSVVIDPKVPKLKRQGLAEKYQGKFVFENECFVTIIATNALIFDGTPGGSTYTEINYTGIDRYDARPNKLVNVPVAVIDKTARAFISISHRVDRSPVMFDEIEAATFNAFNEADYGSVIKVTLGGRPGVNVNSILPTYEYQLPQEGLPKTITVEHRPHSQSIWSSLFGSTSTNSSIGSVRQDNPGVIGRLTNGVNSDNCTIS